MPHLIAGPTFAALVMFAIIEHAPEIHLHFVIDLQERGEYFIVVFYGVFDSDLEKQVSGLCFCFVTTYLCGQISVIYCVSAITKTTVL